jgi:plasmid maintenance system antidote protein VapI
MKERIIEFLRAENKSSSQFAEEIGVQPSGISHIISGRNKPSLDFVLKMIEKYPFISMEWLLFGKGTMYSSKEMQDLFTESVDLSVPNTGRNVEMTHDNEHETRKNLAENIPLSSASGDIDKIVFFYRDGTFRDYKPDRE